MDITAKRNDTTGFWSSSDAPGGRDWQTDERPDVQPAAPPAAPPAPPCTYASTVRPARSPRPPTRRDAPLPPTAVNRLGRTQVIIRNDRTGHYTDNDETDWDTGAPPLRVRAP